MLSWHGNPAEWLNRYLFRQLLMREYGEFIKLALVLSSIFKLLLKILLIEQGINLVACQITNNSLF